MLLFYKDDPENPHGEVEINEACLGRLPVDGTLQDVSRISYGDKVDVEETTLELVQ